MAFRFSCPVEVRFRDCDAMGHVNNAVYYNYTAGKPVPVPEAFRARISEYEGIRDSAT